MNDELTTLKVITEKDIFKKHTKKIQKKIDEDLAVLALAWDYEQSAGKMKVLVTKWKDMSIEVMRGLWEAHHALSEAGREIRSQNLMRGSESPKGTNGSFGKTWAEYCDEVGISKETARRWLKRFVPREISASGEDLLLSPEELKMIEDERSEKSDAWVMKTVDEYEATRVRPAGWNQACENELQHRATMRRVEERVDELVSAWSNKPKAKQLTFFEEWEKMHEYEDIRLPDPRLTQYQFKFFDSIDDYLRSFDDIDLRARAAQNLNEKIRRRLNEDMAQVLMVEDQIREKSI